MKHHKVQVFLVQDIFYVSPLKKVGRTWHLISNLPKPLGPQLSWLPGFDDCCGGSDHDGDYVSISVLMMFSHAQHRPPCLVNLVLLSSHVAGVETKAQPAQLLHRGFLHKKQFCWYACLINMRHCCWLH